MRPVIIVESPTKAKYISQVLGDLVKAVIATYGHLIDLPSDTVGVAFEDNGKMIVQMQVIPGREEVIRRIREVCDEADVIIATDPDREGEAIAESVRKIIETNATSVRRADLYSMTPNDIRKLLDKDRPIHQGQVLAQRSRRVADRLIGYTLSPMLAEEMCGGSPRSLSIGRVQAAIVRLVDIRERKRLSQGEERHFKLKLLDYSGAAFTSLENYENEDKAAEKIRQITTSGDVFEITGVLKKRIVEPPPPPLTTSEMIHYAHHALGWRPRDTMSAAQALYERGLISYPRTDSTRLAPETMESLRKYLAMRNGKSLLPADPVLHKDPSVFSAHEAIRPMMVSLEWDPDYSSGKTRDIPIQLLDLYRLIWERSLACQAKETLWQNVAVDVVPRGLKDTVFLFRGRFAEAMGWRNLLSVSFEERTPSTEQNGARSLAQRQKGHQIKGTPFVVSLSQDILPHYTEGTLIRDMGISRIGTPSTYASVLEKVERKGLLSVEPDQSVRLGDKGRGMLSWVEKKYPIICDIAFTRYIEDLLDKVEMGKVAWEEPVLTAARAIKIIEDDPGIEMFFT